MWSLTLRALLAVAPSVTLPSAELAVRIGEAPVLNFDWYSLRGGGVGASCQHTDYRTAQKRLVGWWGGRATTARSALQESLPAFGPRLPIRIWGTNQ